MKKIPVLLVLVQTTVFAQIEHDPLDIRVRAVGEPVRHVLGADFTTGRFTTDSHFDSSLARRLQRALDSVRYVYNAKGVSAAVYVPGEGMWQGVSGVSTIIPLDSIRHEMIFCIGSNTKAFISAMTLRLVEEGRLSLSDETQRWLTPRSNINNTATIRQLLNMTAGNFDYLNDGRTAVDSINANPSRYWTPEEIISRFVGPPRFPPGTSWRYSNTNYILLGMILKAVTGVDPHVLLRQRIVNPLALQSTFFAIQESLAAPIAHPWYQGADIYWIPWTAWYSMAGTAGAMCARPSDMARWIRALHEGQVIRQPYVDSMRVVIPLANPYLDRYYGYGLGIIRESMYGKVMYTHSGHIPGYLSMHSYEPQTGIASAILFNQSPSAPLYATEQALYIEALPKPRVPYSTPWTLYATSGNADGGRLLRVDTATVSVNPVGPYIYPEIVSLAVHPRSHELFGIAKDYVSYHIVRIDPSTGNAWPVSILRIDPSTPVKGMAFRRDTLYVGGSSVILYRVDVASGTATFVSTTRMDIAGLAFHPRTGELWISDRWNDSLYTLDLSTLQTRSVGSTRINRGTTDIVFDPRGMLYGLVGSVSDTNRLIRIDQATGTGTVIGPFLARPILALAMSPDTTTVNVGPTIEKLPIDYALEQNYPNPFNPATIINYHLPTISHVTLTVFDVLGREVATLVNEVQGSGFKSVTFDASNLASGVYLYRLSVRTPSGQTGNFVETKKLVVLR